MIPIIAVDTSSPRLPSARSYRSSSIKRQRRSKAEIDAIREAIYKVVARDKPMTVRQIFYRLVALGIIDKTEAEYRQTAGRLLTAMRRAGDIPFNWIADNTRWMRKPRTYSSLGQALQRTLEHYRRAVWDNQNAYVEVWLEKEALAGVLVEVTEEWDVPLMVTRGYPSLSYLYAAGMMIKGMRKPVFLYYFGDYDPSGLDIARSVEQGIRAFAPRADLHFERVAVTPEQITTLNLPTRPTKQSDSRARLFKGNSVEVDAIEAGTLRELAHDCIARHVDETALEVLVVAEQNERTLLERWIGEALE
jgi:hypothetical protein